MLPLEARVSRIQIQPIKGGGPLELTEARMKKSGLETIDGLVLDHFLFVVNGEPDHHGDHNFLTQRVQIDQSKELFVQGTPQLALIRPELRQDRLVLHFGNDEIVTPYMEEDDLSQTLPVQLWEYRGRAVQVPVLSEWLSDHLQRKVLVARTSGPWDRMSRQNFEVNDNPLRAQDGYPIHAVSLQDAEAIFAAINSPTDPNRFRYQLLLDGVPFQQIHDYYQGEINGAEITQPKPCGRCEVTGIDQEKGEFSKVKPLAGLVKLKVGRWVRSAEQKDFVVGENWLPKGEAVIHQGDTFSFTQLRKEALIFEQKT